MNAAMTDIGVTPLYSAAQEGHREVVSTKPAAAH